MLESNVGYDWPQNKDERVSEPQIGMELVVPLTTPTVVNVASVPQRSPFRYPGGKTWLVPYLRRWLSTLGPPIPRIVEPFAGGAIVSLTAVAEEYAVSATLGELDEDMAAVWQVLLNGKGDWLADEVLKFSVTEDSVRSLLHSGDTSLPQRALRTIVRNRVNRGGILAPGAGLVKQGENGKGLTSRWYPETLRRRMLDIVRIKERLDFRYGDGFALFSEFRYSANIAFFIDPPYVGAGRRLYTHSQIDHRALFREAGALCGAFLMTYDDAPEILDLVEEQGFEVERVPMKSTHHSRKMELLISRNLDWLRG